MTRAELRNKNIDIIVHPVLIGTDNGQEKRYMFSIFNQEEEVGSMEEGPDFKTYEEAEKAAVTEALTFLQTLEN